MLLMGLSAAVAVLSISATLISGSCNFINAPQYLCFLYTFLQNFYRFAPCEAAVYAFMGWTFLWWNIQAYLLSIILFSSWLLYSLGRKH